MGVHNSPSRGFSAEEVTKSCPRYCSTQYLCDEEVGGLFSCTMWHGALSIKTVLSSRILGAFIVFLVLHFPKIEQNPFCYFLKFCFFSEIQLNILGRGEVCIKWEFHYLAHSI